MRQPRLLAPFAKIVPKDEKDISPDKTDDSLYQMSDKEQRQAEIESLESIFPDLLSSRTERQLDFKFDRNISMTITLPDDYPSK